MSNITTTIRITELPGGYASSHLVEHIFEDAEAFFDYLMVVHIAASKAVAPCILPCTLRAGPGSTTKSGRRRVTDAAQAHLLVFDLDHGNVEESDLEAALVEIGIQAAMYPTWKSGGVHGMRWRVIVPLARPVPGGAYKAVWVPVARAIERGLYSQAAFDPSTAGSTGRERPSHSLPSCPAARRGGPTTTSSGASTPKSTSSTTGCCWTPASCPNCRRSGKSGRSSGRIEPRSPGPTSQRSTRPVWPPTRRWAGKRHRGCWPRWMPWRSHAGMACRRPQVIAMQP